MARGTVTCCLLLLAVMAAVSFSSAARLPTRQHHRPVAAAAAAGAERRILQAPRPLLGLDRANRKLRVLAFGDSITEGWIHSAWTKVSWVQCTTAAAKQLCCGYFIDKCSVLCILAYSELRRYPCTCRAAHLHMYSCCDVLIGDQIGTVAHL
jgi:hypothetical protein